MYILGISAFHHDSAACIMEDGNIIAAGQEERFTFKKHDQNFPIKEIKYRLIEVDKKPSELAHVAFYDKPFLSLKEF